MFGLVGKRVGHGKDWVWVNGATGVEGILLRVFEEREGSDGERETPAILSRVLIVCSPSPRISDEL